MIVNCVAYQRGRRLADLSIAEIRQYTNQPDCFVWVALKDPEPAELEALQSEFDLHELAVEDASHGHQRPKIEEYGHSIFVVLHPVETVELELHIGEVAVFVGSNYIVSVRRNVRQGFADVRARSESEPELLRHGPAFVLYALMDAVVDRYLPVLDSLSEEVEEIEDRIFTGQSTKDNVEALYGLKRKLMILRHAAGPLLEATGKLHGGRVPAVCSGLQEYFRDVSDHLVRVTQGIDNLRDMVSTAMSVNLSLITIQETEVTKRLAAYAALVAVPTLIAGVYGMNFDYMPELRWRFGYLVALGTMAGIDTYLAYRFRQAGWL
ncbi:MAG: magnesium/cobalt transporter CorA [Acidobacteria bacterium]|nr:magnesium/cobalt transporter CorA [Acidobacteriota bacterium]